MRQTGKVYIVGAGPGDPELVTLKAVRLIGAGDVILYDRLVGKELLAHAKPGAELIYCGKAPGRHAMQQEMINKALVAYAQEGKTVVRLKGGDPFIFGRGGEEALELAAAGIPYEIVPGITSAIGAAAYSSIPLTHRGSAASFACVTGSRCRGGETGIRWDLLAHSVDTLVIYMGVSHLPDIRQELLAHGKDASTPVALIERGTTNKQRTVVGTLADIHELAESQRVKNPALIVVGEVVKVREQLAGLEQQALAEYGYGEMFG
ncbi:uroporphyrinogen-III C-methyltransferase [Paenibacillus beijingensis]|uniref:Uroporphyrinogen-III C-methyltransferase n=1 Tax=Paenibacillus beijingensis TaxID=1126833 RepID=A0A0D5NLY3_9BACL|nr:uroporphyrinogen-III C-methyltransferase [Paenibacillus beijingensis]AJY76017.1 uroporphyrin-III methyltransferase [Paenibacillus beijingensis]